MHRIIGLIFTVSLLLVCNGAQAANLLTNPGFTTDVSSWVLEQPVSSSVSWVATDANGAPGSGSAQITNTHASASQGTGISQCAGAVTGGSNYTYGGKILYPTGQARTGDMEVGLRWYGSANCTGTDQGQPRLSTNTPNGTWVSLNSGTVAAPGGAVSVQFVAFPSKVEAGGSLVGLFDDLYIDSALATYTVTYNGNGNTGGSAPVDGSSPYNSGATVTVLGQGTLARTGFTFSGWNTAANGSGVPYAANATFSMGSGNVTLFAQWTALGSPAATFSTPTLSQWLLLALVLLLAAAGALRARN
jgi:uncharacterized repeat protein (TIGR02543 family)